MEIWEIAALGAALAMDAVAVSLGNGMAEPRMSARKMLVCALAFALFQAGMPLVGYALGEAFSELVGRIAPYLSFALLAFIGGKMAFDGIAEGRERSPRLRLTPRRKLTAPVLFMQAVATSLDALAVGVTFLAVDCSGGLPMHVALCALVIGAITFALSLPAAAMGRRVGDRFSDRAEVVGGAVLLFIGAKILLDGLF